MQPMSHVTNKAFAASRSDEATLPPHHSVHTLKSFDDGWSLVESASFPISGFIPSSFLSKQNDGLAFQTPSKCSSIPLRHSSLFYETARLTSDSATRRTVRDIETRNTPSEAVLIDLIRRQNMILRTKESRAFTPASCGQLKIMLAGDTGIGKTSLIESFMRSPFSSLHSSSSKKQTSEFPVICEIPSSTLPHDSTVMDPSGKCNNITFVDTPGLGAFMDASSVIQPCLEYITSQFEKTNAFLNPNIEDHGLSKFLNNLGAGGGLGHVDVCLYCVLHRVKPVDIEFMRLLAAHVTLVPIVLKSDTMSLESVFSLKKTFLHHLSRSNIPIYGFGLGEQELTRLAEFHVGELLWRSLLCNHLADLRRLGVERFLAWRTVNNTSHDK
ncbi:Septin-domain-containing protein [Chytriomyces cf. hyalinus JEL632]|nr:Septin-domain-containing protein [Chytriomyces cf. hyalinus JEL632]